MDIFLCVGVCVYVCMRATLCCCEVLSLMYVNILYLRCVYALIVFSLLLCNKICRYYHVTKTKKMAFFLLYHIALDKLYIMFWVIYYSLVLFSQRKGTSDCLTLYSRYINSTGLRSERANGFSNLGY